MKITKVKTMEDMFFEMYKAKRDNKELFITVSDGEERMGMSYLALNEYGNFRN